MTAIRTSIAGTILAALLTTTVSANEDASQVLIEANVTQLSTHMGEMQMGVDVLGLVVDNALRFEPFQSIGDMFGRDDVVYLMRHGPTDWSKLDMADVAPADCGNQRVMSPEGRQQMADLGALLASNNLVPSRIVVSEWCRNQQTYEALMQGMGAVDDRIARDMPMETDPGLNLLLSLQGAKSVEPLRQRIAAWDGDPERNGPLLLITHYTNIEELTQFRVFEGEVLVIDPDRENRVLGYIRLRSASPDVGHFADAMASPLNKEEMAFDMVERYYRALNTRDAEQFAGLLADDWFMHGESPSLPSQDMDTFLAEVGMYVEGIPDIAYEIDSLHFADDVVTTIGTLSGTHTGPILGIEGTGRHVEFGAIAVHRVRDGVIYESWQLPDRLGLLQQIQQE
ncbi:Predicted ester cyclase [Roseivivax sediminis]|uniref:Predicted ester cyclase n=2 Tax=Roseivivax sediminis TaxID=936889 RepID=A0A1I1SWQ2_9RHOB|nr:Predicted ester cyclase [Roseivivax sediminis]